MLPADTQLGLSRAEVVDRLGHDAYVSVKQEVQARVRSAIAVFYDLRMAHFFRGFELVEVAARDVVDEDESFVGLRVPG